MYSVRRKRHWTIEVRKDMVGGHNYAAWIGARSDRPLHPPVYGWAAGGRQDALIEAQMDIDMLDGRPDNFAGTPKFYHHQ